MLYMCVLCACWRTWTGDPRWEINIHVGWAKSAKRNQHHWERAYWKSLAAFIPPRRLCYVVVIRYGDAIHKATLNYRKVLAFTDWRVLITALCYKPSRLYQFNLFGADVRRETWFLSALDCGLCTGWRSMFWSCVGCSVIMSFGISHRTLVSKPGRILNKTELPRIGGSIHLVDRQRKKW